MPVMSLSELNKLLFHQEFSNMPEFTRLVDAVVLLAQVASQLIAAYQATPSAAEVEGLAVQVETVIADIQAALPVAPV